MVFDGFGGELQAVDEPLDLARCDLVQIQVANSLIDLGRYLAVIVLCPLAQRLVHIFHEPLFRKRLKLDMSISEG